MRRDETRTGFIGMKADLMDPKATVFVVRLGDRRYRKFTTLDMAIAFCSEHFRLSGVVLSIVAKG